MPELPEVENVRQSLEARLVGRTFRRVLVRRRDIVTHSARPDALLVGDSIVALKRHGKQLAMIGETGRAVCIHLGMTGSLRWHACGAGSRPAAQQTHVHLRWTMDDGNTIAFRDPRRFGGIWTFDSVEALHAQRWARLGPDALRVTPGDLHARLRRKRLGLKAALLDQAVVAGLGNIYVDELLFACRLSPLQPACTVELGEIRGLVRRMRLLLSRAIQAGGSTLRDYVDGEGAAGGFQHRHQVYGRAGEPCRACRQILSVTTVAGRTTVYCGRCQPAGSGSFL